METTPTDGMTPGEMAFAKSKGADWAWFVPEKKTTPDTHTSYTGTRLNLQVDAVYGKGKRPSSAPEFGAGVASFASWFSVDDAFLAPLPPRALNRTRFSIAYYGAGGCSSGYLAGFTLFKGVPVKASSEILNLMAAQAPVNVLAAFFTGEQDGVLETFQAAGWKVVAEGPTTHGRYRVYCAGWGRPANQKKAGY